MIKHDRQLCAMAPAPSVEIAFAENTHYIVALMRCVFFAKIDEILLSLVYPTIVALRDTRSS